MEFGDTEETKAKIAEQIRRADNWAIEGIGVPLFSSPPVYARNPILPPPIRTEYSIAEQIKMVEDWATVPAEAYL